MKYCFFTPSYRGDIDRIKIMRQSILYFVKENLPHYIVVPKEDINLFKNSFASDESVTILTQNDYVDNIFYPTKLYNFINTLTPSQSWRISKQSGRPGWIIQQIVKLNIPNIIEEDAALIVDSDVFFIKPFSIFDIVDSSFNTRVLIRQHPLNESAMQRKHIAKSREILAIPPGNTDFHYMSWPVVYYKDWGKLLLEYIQKKHDHSWQNVLYDTNIFSEYSIYGIYLDEILKPNDLNVVEKSFYQGIWDRNDFNQFIAGKFNLNQNIFCIVVQSNLSIPVESYSKHFKYFLEKASQNHYET